MIQLRLPEVEAEIENVNETMDRDFSANMSFDGPWSTYVTHLSVLYFLLECVMHLPGKRNHYMYDFSWLDRGDLRRVGFQDDVPYAQNTYGTETTADRVRFGKLQLTLTDKKRHGSEREFFDDMHSLYQEVTKRDLLKEVAAVAKCLSHYKTRDFESALLWTWIWLEGQTSRLWVEHLENNGIGGERKKRMLGRDYTAAIQIDSLALLKVISEEELKVLTTIRQSRNDLVHDGKLSRSRPSIEDTTRDALRLLQTFFRRRHRIHLSFHAHPNATSGL